MRYTQATEQSVRQADCLIIDCYGLLSSIYRYGEMAYVGGGFGVGIHNVPEAAVYGIPVLVGPNNKKFCEAQALLATGGCIEVTDQATVDNIMDKLLADKEYLMQAGSVAGRYISGNAGASDVIYRTVFGS